jgi:hypothetical protein
MRDFTLSGFRFLCRQFSIIGYKFTPFVDYLSSHGLGKIVIMRHDVDRMPEDALAMANVERKLGIRTSYYFRIVASSYSENIIRKIALMGHEIGYHYEDLTLARGDYEEAISSFKENISKLRGICKIKTICMHGSPLSKWDNRQLWQRYDYHDFGVIGEPYFDIDFDEVLYLTDTGRSWNGGDSNIRDKVHASDRNFTFRRTTDIMAALRNSSLPNKLMLNIHPQRWHDSYIPWFRELVWQNTKNLGKRIFIARK